jgi:manganese transport system substrate-binding protein
MFGMPKFLFRCAKVAARTLARRSAAFSAATAAAVVLSLSMTACGGDASGDSGKDKPVVLTTFTVLADVARNVAGDKLTVESITKAGAEIHGYEPTPGDIRKAAKADLILDNGLNLEAWFAQFVEGLDVPHAVVSDGVQVMSIGEDSYQGKPNPHAWMSPMNVQIYVDNMVKAFTELDPDNADVFRANGDAYKAKLQAVQDEMKASLAGVPENQRALVTCEGAFSYLARDAGLREVYIWAVNAEQQATPQQITRAIEYVRANQVPAVFCESTVSDAPMQQVVGATGTKFGGVLYVDSLSEADGPVPSYLDLIRHDADVITKALAGASAGIPAATKP